MKIITIIGADKVKSTDTLHRVGKDLTVEGDDEMSVSDGYHTIEELYDHRVELFLTLCRILSADTKSQPLIWRTKKHFDGSKFDGWFILGIEIRAGKQITYHLPLSRWDDAGFALTIIKAPEFDHHTPNDVLKRLKKL